MNLPDPAATARFVDRYWEQDALPVLSNYLTVHSLSPDFDPSWEEHGALLEAARLFADWAGKRPLDGLAVELLEVKERTPCVLVEVGSTAGREAPSSLMYGHLDKQPPLGVWQDGLDAFTPVRRGDNLYGRGAADDGYAIFAALGAIETLEAAGVPHGKVTILIEASEESASVDLDRYLDELAPRIGSPALVVCLDSGGPTFDRLWTTASLRGLIDGVLTVRVLTESIHSGLGGGVVPPSFRLLRQLLDRIDDPITGDVRLEAAGVEVPPERRDEMDSLAAAGIAEEGALPTVPGIVLEGRDARDRLERNAWRAALEITGGEGLPPIEEAGNLLRAATSVKVSLRIPPTADSEEVAAALSEALTSDPPARAEVTFKPGHAADGWSAPPMPAWLAEATRQASESYFGNPPMASGTGGTIPFMAALAERYPAAQFLATGVLGPGSNAHGTDESLHIPTAKSLTACVAHIHAVLAEQESGD
jgi:acetylornithine deacetylase/succinyl-diaminopimelate desuccinylase-like protein